MTRFLNTDLDVTLGGLTPSDEKVSSQKATKTYVDTQLSTKQDSLVSGTNIKTLNNESLLGEGDIDITSAQWGNITGTLSNQTDLKNALDAKQPVGNYAEVDKSNKFTQPQTIKIHEASQQSSALKVLSQDVGASNAWKGRLVAGSKNKTFLMGVYNNLPILGAHSWTDSDLETGAAWEDLYINSDGYKSVYVGGVSNTANTGILKIQNNGTTNFKAYYNKGTIGAPDFKEIATEKELAAKQDKLTSDNAGDNISITEDSTTGIAKISADLSSITDNYLPLSGGTMTGAISFDYNSGTYGDEPLIEWYNHTGGKSTIRTGQGGAGLIFEFGATAGGKGGSAAFYGTAFYPDHPSYKMSLGVQSRHWDTLFVDKISATTGYGATVNNIMVPDVAGTMVVATDPAAEGKYVLKTEKVGDVLTTTWALDNTSITNAEIDAMWEDTAKEAE